MYLRETTNCALENMNAKVEPDVGKRRAVRAGNNAKDGQTKVRGL